MGFNPDRTIQLTALAASTPVRDRGFYGPAPAVVFFDLTHTHAITNFGGGQTIRGMIKADLKQKP